MKNSILYTILYLFPLLYSLGAILDEPPPLDTEPPKIPPDSYLESDFGFRIHPNIEKAISQDGEWPIYYIVNLAPARTENYKYLYLKLGIFNGHFGHFGLIVRDKVENKEWEDVEILNSTYEIEKGILKYRLGHWLMVGEFDIDLLWANEIERIQEYNKASERNSEPLRSQNPSS